MIKIFCGIPKKIGGNMTINLKKDGENVVEINVQGIIQKNSMVTMKLARAFLLQNPGNRILTIAEYAEEFGTARGTVQTALRILVEENCISLVKRGNQGSFIKEIDHLDLWNYAGWDVVIGGVLLYNFYSGALKNILKLVKRRFEDKKFPYTHAFIGNNNTYIDALSKGKIDFLITSKLVADVCIQLSKDLEISYEFKKNKFLHGNVLVYKNRKSKKILDGMSMAYDGLNIEQQIIADKLCSKYRLKSEASEAKNLAKNFMENEYNVCIMDEKLAEKHNLIPYSAPIEDKITGGLDRKAVLLSSRNNYKIRGLLSSLMYDNYSDLGGINRKICRK